MELEEIKRKYRDIEDKVPLIWANYEDVAMELSHDIGAEYEIKDPEIIRVIALVDMKISAMGITGLNLLAHIYKPFAFAGLYPEKIKKLDITPEVISIGEALEAILKQERFIYSRGGKVSGNDILKIMGIINDTFEGDFMIFDNAGGRAFDIATNLAEFTNRVKDFKDILIEETAKELIHNTRF
jgi:hypothetical protein